MMLYPSMSDLLTKVDSRYMLVNVVARRAREIAEKAEETKNFLDEKSVSIAIKEIADGKVSIIKTAPSDEENAVEAEEIVADEIEEAAAETEAEAEEVQE